MNENLRTSQVGIDLITRWESCVLKQYICAAGKPTIGIGHVVLPSENFPPTITKEFAQELLAKDLIRFEQAIYRRIKVELNQNQFDALVCFIFNTGEGGLFNFKKNAETGVCKAVNERRFQDVPAALAEWSKARVNGELQVLEGLLRRRQSEGALFARPVGAVSVEAASSEPTKPMTVLEIQQALIRLGYDLGKSGADGVAGNATKMAIVAFQKANSLDADGIAGPKTMQALCALASKVA